MHCSGRRFSEEGSLPWVVEIRAAPKLGSQPILILIRGQFYIFKALIHHFFLTINRSISLALKINGQSNWNCSEVQQSPRITSIVSMQQRTMHVANTFACTFCESQNTFIALIGFMGTESVARRFLYFLVCYSLRIISKWIKIYWLKSVLQLFYSIFPTLYWLLSQYWIKRNHRLQTAPSPSSP